MGTMARVAENARLPAGARPAARARPVKRVDGMAVLPDSDPAAVATLPAVRLAGQLAPAVRPTELPVPAGRRVAQPETARPPVARPTPRPGGPVSVRLRTRRVAQLHGLPFVRLPARLPEQRSGRPAERRTRSG